MNNLILCEGKTDAALLSYCLEETCDRMRRKALKNLDIRAGERKNESIYWHLEGEESLLICGVGGKDNFDDFFKQKIQATMINNSAFRLLSGVLYM